MAGTVRIEEPHKGAKFPYQEREYLHLVLQNIGEAVVTTDMNGGITFMNGTAEALAGWNLKEVLGRPLCDVFRAVDGTTRTGRADIAGAAIRTGHRIRRYDTVLFSRDGTEMMVEESASPLLDEEGNIHGAIILLRKTSGRHAAAGGFPMVGESESLNTHIGGIAHDLNNLLFGILGNVSQAIASTEEGSRVRKVLLMVEKAALLARRLTQQLSTFSNPTKTSQESSSLSELIEETASFILHDSKTRCKISIPDDIWRVEADDGQIVQVLSNLIINADQAMSGDGTILVAAENITARGQSFLKDGARYVKLSVTDQGVGIPDEYLSQIFAPYFTTKENGRGLGLATTYSIIKKLGGHIIVDTEKEAGTTFHVYLPASTDKTGKKKKKTAEGGGVFGKAKILVLDDDELVRYTLNELISDIGHEVKSVGDGDEAVSEYKKAREAGEPFDAVIIDLTIPGGMGGDEVMKKLLGVDPDVKAIVSSGDLDNPVMSRFGSHGFSGVISKPFTVEALRETLHRVISR